MTTGSTGDNVTLMQSGPNAAGTGWTIVLKNNGATTTVVAALSVVCLTVPGL